MKLRAADILHNCSVSVSPETFALVSVREDDWPNVMSDPERSPRMNAPFMIFKDKFEFTLLLDETDLSNMRPALSSAKIESGFRMITFETALDFDVVGFMAEVARILAASGVAIFPISAFSRDHVLVKQNEIATALKALGPHVKELC